MAYSFTEPTKDTLRADSESSSDSVECKVPPMMVPVADVLNHVTENNAKLIFGIDSLKMVATRPIDEVFTLWICKIIKQLCQYILLMLLQSKLLTLQGITKLIHVQMCKMVHYLEHGNSYGWMSCLTTQRWVFLAKVKNESRSFVCSVSPYPLSHWYYVPFHCPVNHLFCSGLCVCVWRCCIMNKCREEITLGFGAKDSGLVLDDV